MSTDLNFGKPAPLSDRQRREQIYFDEYVHRHSIETINFESVDGHERRPWNPYWYVAQVLREYYVLPSQRLLDFGCGSGNYSMMWARLGYEVFGFDVSEKSVLGARQLAEHYNCVDRAHFEIGTAENLNYPSGFFDVVAGVDILHHVDISDSIRECFRVLKPGGIAVFKEPIEVPIFDSLRNTRLAKCACPNEKSFERGITEDERKITKRDVGEIAAHFPNLEIQRFRLFSRLDAFWRTLRVQGGESKLHFTFYRALEKFDQACFNYLPFLKPFGGDVVLTLTKPAAFSPAKTPGGGMPVEALRRCPSASMDW
jgi:2-polyprenyl-3-methyl-5-hydroxy-6-metoxy-1,4-benzoquinol methylase